MLSVAVSSRSLFDLEAENAVYESKGIDAFRHVQREKLNEPAKPGVAYPLVKKLLALNGIDPELPKAVEVAIVSKNDPSCGRRLVKSCQHYSLPVAYGLFTGGSARTPYLRLIGANLFLSASPADARCAIEAGVPAACVGAGPMLSMPDSEQIRICFDGDAVLFSDEAQRVYEREGIEAFNRHEAVRSSEPLPPGPMHNFLAALHTLRTRPTFRDRIRIALITARSMDAADRAMHTMDTWGLAVDEAYFLRGRPKADWVTEFNADFFFDDTLDNFASTKDRVPSGHVVYGVTNNIK